MVLYEKQFKSTFRIAASIVDEIVDMLRNSVGVSKSLGFRVSFMLREVLNNAVEHGNGFDEEKLISVLVERFESQLSFKVKDEGPGFNLEVLEILPEDVDRVRNRGILLVMEFGFDVNVIDNVVMVRLNLDETTNS